MRRLRWLGLGLLLATAGGSLAVQTVGVPAILRLTSLGLGMAPQQPGNGTALQANAAYNGSADVALLENTSGGTLASTRMRLTDGNNSLILSMANSANSGGLAAALTAGNTNMPVCLNSSATGICVQGTPSQITLNGTPTVPWVPGKIARANVASNGTFSNGVNLGATSHSAGTGAYTIPFSAAYSTAPVCVASADSGSTPMALNVQTTTSQVIVSEVLVNNTTGGTPTDNAFHVLCIGT